MKRDSRLSDVLHVLLHMAEFQDSLTSQALAKAMRTHPVVIRRTMAGLREQGYVRSERGHGGGWRLSCDLSQVTLRDIYVALGEPCVLALGHRAASPDCLVEQTVNARVGEAMTAAEAVFLRHIRDITLADLSDDFHQRLVRYGGLVKLERVHGS